MRELEVSIGIIQQGDDYLLQQRPNNPAIGAAGLIGAYGGMIEAGETPLEAVCRELSEETSLSPVPEDFKHLGTVEVTADRNNEPVRIMATVFRMIIAPGSEVISNDGRLVRMTRTETDAAGHRLTPATKAAFEQLI